MHVVRLGDKSAEVGADVRAALAAWGAGRSVLGGVAVLGARPPGSPRPMEAVIAQPRGIVVVHGVDLPEPAAKLDAPLGTPWTVDGWPLVRTEGKVNPGQEGLESAAALARSAQSRGMEPLPVAAIVAVGPYAGQITQPTADLHRGVRVISPSTTALLAAARELATYETPCSAESARELLRLLGVEREDDLDVELLLAEGFPASPETDLARRETALIPKYAEPSRPAAARVPRRPVLIAAAALLVVLCAVLAIALAWPRAEPVVAQRVDGVRFTEQAVSTDTSCARHAFGDLRSWFEQHGCSTLRRESHRAAASGGPVRVSVVEIGTGAPEAAAELRALATAPGTGGITALGGRERFAGAARVVEQRDAAVRIVQTAWSNRESSPDDTALRAMAERALRLTPR
ncbi:hypothetical protein [Saccharopolyspora griseoalba]|uniref:Uncharacterized protein n=1 Tax=Saccharopolyspora griseoalba TaxID=1431848 RepID=A0ABW2LKS7_9PSEU